MCNISVIVPIYKVENYVAELLRSLFEQSLTSGVEFILVNDATPDSSMDIARSVAADYPHLDIRFLDKPQNEGLACARQSGVEMARGEYLLTIDSDDLCAPTMLEEMYQRAVEDDADIVVTDYIFKYEDREVYTPNPHPSSGKGSALLLLSDRVEGYVWCKLFRRSLLTDNGIGWTPHIDYCEDLLISVKLFMFTDRISYIPRAYIYYRQLPNSMINCINIEKFAVNLTALYSELEELFRLKGCGQDFFDIIITNRLALKFTILHHSKSKEERRERARLFSELTPYTLSHCKKSIVARMALYFASRGFLLPFNILYKR